MRSYRSSLLRAVGAALPCAVFVFPVAAIAQQPPASPPPETPPEAAAPALLPVRLDAALYGGLTYRLRHRFADVTRGGGLLGLSALFGPPEGAWSAGLGYERSFFGSERTDASGGAYTDVSRGLDALWLLGRVYPYQSDDFILHGTLGVAPVWERVSASSVAIATDSSGMSQPRVVACSGGGSVGLGFRLGAGAQLAINKYLGFDASVGIDGTKVSDDAIDGCALGMGSETALAARFGFVVTLGRAKPPAPVPPPPKPSDRDGDGIADAVDACPLEPGVASPVPSKHGCPPPGDRDGDGITDDVDACPDERGVASSDPRTHGCAPPPPPDRDGDQVADAQDACPDIAGVATTDPATNGCPPDTDEDGIRDDKDACREVKGVPSEDPAKHGCPLVVFTENEIVIAQQVQFAVDKAVIQPVSNGLLDEVASVIKQHPEILVLEVQGHTDNTGNQARNKVLSKSRADAVRKALIQRGVGAAVLKAQGYGQDQPIADNATAEGKALNRRVQFKILQKK